MESILHDRMVSLTNPTVAPYCKSGEVRLRVTAKATDEASAALLCDGLVEEICKDPAISPYVYGVDCENIETALVRLFAQRGLTVATAESCTGGLIGSRITAVSGASQVFLGGFLTYTNDIKISLLGVSPDSITAHTEVSAEVAREMAEGARLRLGADVGLSATGYAGPTGGTEENPVGTVFVGVSIRGGTTAFRLYYPRKSRDYVREASASRVMLEAIRSIL